MGLWHWKRTDKGMELEVEVTVEWDSRDCFNAEAGGLSGKTLPAGGNWEHPTEDHTMDTANNLQDHWHNYIQSLPTTDKDRP